MEEAILVGGPQDGGRVKGVGVQEGGEGKGSVVVAALYEILSHAPAALAAFAFVADTAARVAALCWVVQAVRRKRKA